MKYYFVTAILDIPIYKSKVQSLHVLFSLYSEFKNSHVSFFNLLGFIARHLVVKHDIENE